MNSTKQIARQNLAAFCEQTSIHGFRYTVDSDNKVVKLVWGFLVVAFISVSIFYVNESFNHWAKMPTITTIQSTAHTIKDLPFPSVTVCRQEQGLRNLERWALVSDILDWSLMDCDRSIDKTNCLSLMNDSRMSTVMMEIEEILYNRSQGIEDMLFHTLDSWNAFVDSLPTNCQDDKIKFIASYFTIMKQNESMEAEIKAKLFSIFQRKADGYIFKLFHQYLEDEFTFK